MSPAEFVDQYLGLRVPTIQADGRPAPGAVPVPVCNYRNNDHRDLAGVGRTLFHFLVAQARRGCPGLSGDAQSVCYSGGGITIPRRTMHEIVRPFIGKGTPDQCREVLTFASLWLALDARQRTTTPTLQRFADQYIGVDCNGFTHAYFSTQFPGTTAAGLAYIPGYREHHSRRRQTLAEIQPLDVLLPNSGNAHIALISSIQQRETNRRGEVVRLHCVIAQSKGEGSAQHPHNGAQYENAVLSMTGPGVFHGHSTPPEWNGLNAYGLAGITPPAGATT